MDCGELPKKWLGSAHLTALSPALFGHIRMLSSAVRERRSAALEYRADPLLRNDCTVLLPACTPYTDAQAPAPLHPAALLSQDHTISAAYASQRTQAPLKPSLLFLRKPFASSPCTQP